MAPLLFEYLVGSGRPDSLQAIDPWDLELERSGPFPTMFPRLMTLGNSSLRRLNVEALLTLHARAYVPMQTVPGAQAAGLPIVAFKSLRDSAWWLADAPMAARLVGDERRQARLLRDFHVDVAAVARDLPPARLRRRQSIFAIAPHFDGSMGSFHHETDPWYAFVGARDDDVDQTTFFINVEHLLLRDPDMIELERTSNFTPSEFMSDPRWRTLKAVRSRRVYERPAGLGFGFVGMLEYPLYARWLAELLYPDSMPRSLRSVMRANYARALGRVLSDAQLDELLVPNNRTSANYSRFAATRT